MITIRNVVIDDMIKILTDMKKTPGVSHVDLNCDSDTGSIEIVPIILTKKGKTLPKDAGLNFNDLSA